MLRVSEFKWVQFRDGYDKARALLHPAIRSGIEEVWDGPEQTTQQRQVELTSQQQNLMAELKRELMITLQDGKEIDAINEAAFRTKFLQIAAGRVYDANHVAHPIDAKPRI